MKEKLRDKYATKLQRLEERIRKTEQRLEKEKDQAKSQTLQSVLSVGAGLVGALFGRKLASATNVRRVGTAARSFSRAGKERGDVGRAEDDLAAARVQYEEMEQQLRADLEEAENAFDVLTEEFDETAIRPKKTDIDVRFLTLLWLPYWQTPRSGREPAWE